MGHYKRNTPYMRRCCRCGDVFRTWSKCGKVCPDCFKPTGENAKRINNQE